jgi:1-phosphatidylinositol-5-phosphate 4-kinase
MPFRAIQVCLFIAFSFFLSRLFVTAAPKRQIYFIGLVDILTYYGVKKRTASAAKSVKYGSEAENISTVKPEQYGRRLVEFATKAVSDD